MKKAEQINTNKIVISNLTDALRELRESTNTRKARLDTCQAYTEETAHFIILTSYNTVVAVYSKLTECVYDALRYVYGYTATSALHIAKFTKKCRAVEVDRYYPV